MHAAQTATAWAYRQTCRCRHFATKRSAQTPCPLKNSLGNCAICLFVACLGKTSNPVFDLIKFTHDSNDLIYAHRCVPNEVKPLPSGCAASGRSVKLLFSSSTPLAAKPVGSSVAFGIDIIPMSMVGLRQLGDGIVFVLTCAVRTGKGAAAKVEGVAADQSAVGAWVHPHPAPRSMRIPTQTDTHTLTCMQPRQLVCHISSRNLPCEHTARTRTESLLLCVVVCCLRTIASNA